MSVDIRAQDETSLASVKAIYDAAERAKADAQRAQEAADEAEGHAQSALTNAGIAQTQAENATKSANAALGQLGVVEDVVGTLNWIAEHGTYKLTTDTEVVAGKYYFTKSGDNYNVVINPTGNPQSQGYYELDSVDEAVANYVSSHLALTDAGLWVTNDNNSYKILLANDGMKVYDASGNLVSTFGESITFNSARPQTIGNNNTYIKYYDSNNDNVADAIEIAGSNVTIASNVTIGGMPTKVSDLQNDSGYQTSGEVSGAISTATSGMLTGVTTKDQYYLSTASNTPVGGTWQDTVPSWSKNHYIWTRVATTKTNANGTTTTYSDAVYDRALTTANSVANTANTGLTGKADKSSAVASTVSVYYRSTTESTPTISSSTSIGTSATTSNAWEYVMPQPLRNCYFYTCEQYTMVNGDVSFSTVRPLDNATYTSKWCSQTDNAFIDGGAIYANSVTASQIATNTITVGSLSDGSNYSTTGEMNTAISTATSDMATNAGVASTYATKVDAVSKEQRIYYRSNSTSAPSAPSTWVTSTSTANATWTTKRMPYDSTYKYLYTCIQKQTVSGAISCTTVLLDDTTTVIDGGNIITGTVTANKLNTTDINNSGLLTTGALTVATQNDILNSNIIDTNTASGAIAHFEDASAYPAIDVTANIEPIQNLNGYTKPWVGGAGKNKLQYGSATQTGSGITFTRNSDGTIKIQGTSTGVADYYFVGTTSTYASSGIATGDYIMTLTGGQSEKSLFYVVKSGGTILASVNGSGSANVHLDASETYRIFIRTQANQTVNLTVSPMIRLSSVSDATYEPYENICPISGWTSVHATRTGKNLFGRIEFGKYIEAGNVTTGSVDDRWAILYIPTEPNTKYSIRIDDLNGYKGSFMVFAYDGNKNYISRVTLIYANNITVPYTATITMPSTAKYLCISGYNSTSNGGVAMIGTTAKIQFEQGETATAYEQYNGETKTVLLGQTVYGGTLDVASGLLTIDRAIVDLGSLTWSYRTTSLKPFFINNFTPMKLKTTLVCSCYEQTAYAPNSANSPNGSIYNEGNFTAAHNLIIRDERYTDATAFKNAVSGQMLVYGLDSPMTLQLTPTQIDLLQGTNNVWVDSGNISVEYATMNSDMLALAGTIPEAAKTATSYITYINPTDGIKVHSANDTTNYAQINSNGMDVVKGGTSVAFYGDTARIGKIDDFHTNIFNKGISLTDNYGMGAFEIIAGDTSKSQTRTLSYRMTGGSDTKYATFTAPLNKTAITFTLTRYLVNSPTTTPSTASTTIATTDFAHSTGTYGTYYGRAGYKWTIGSTATTGSPLYLYRFSDTEFLSEIDDSDDTHADYLSLSYTATAYPISMRNSNGNTLLWSGAWFMNAGQVAFLNESVTSQLSGIVLVWGGYSSGALNQDWNFTYIPKSFVINHEGNGVSTGLLTRTGSLEHVGSKYVYVYNDRVVGHANNQSTGTASSITYTNSRWVLRYIYGV